MKKENKEAFVIIRVTAVEKESLQKAAKRAHRKFSAYIRLVLGLDK